MFMALISHFIQICLVFIIQMFIIVLGVFLWQFFEVFQLLAKCKNKQTKKHLLQKPDFKEPIQLFSLY